MPKKTPTITGPDPYVLDVNPSFKDWSLTVEASTGASGIVTIKYKRVGVSKRKTLTSVNLSGLGEPETFNFSGKMDDFEFSASSLSGSYTVTADGE